MESVKKCGCKGIRTCLFCEKEGKLSNIEDENKGTDQYEYCPHCNLCWPLDRDAGEVPLYLGKLTVIPDFVTVEEEREIVASIDSMEWMPSQSGRRKQDFGPKVNFKKKKSKIGDFKGFPRFTEYLIKRLEQCVDLSDFRPVELCHLDYEPGRGSAIEPHIDDTWIWGERLVTLNLVSPTVLTLTPANSETACDCQTQCLNTTTGSTNDNKHCNCSLDCSFKANSLDVLDSNPVQDKSATYRIELNSLKVPLEEDSVSLTDSNLVDDTEQNYPKTTSDYQRECFRTHVESINESELCNNKIPVMCAHERSVNSLDVSTVEAMCTAYRMRNKRRRIEVLVPLPLRSLVVVSGCSRHHWFHEIKRKDIVSRRLAMTFRELSRNFVSGGSDEIVGRQLLELGRTFWEMNV